jgi:Ni/Fe-hydrogenase subunit HybB-like protein
MTANAREASLRPFGKPGPGWWLVVGALSAVVAVGIYAWVLQLRGGMGVAGYNDHAFWAIYIADVVTFIGVSYGGAVVSAILRLTGATWRAPLTRLAEGTAVVTVLIGSSLIIPHIGRPERLWELLAHPNLSAPVFWDFVAVMTYTAASVVFFALPLVPDMAVLAGDEHSKQLGRGRRTLYKFVSRGWEGAPRQRRVLAGALGLVSIMIIPLAVSVHSVLAWAFATTSRPWWHESIWAPQFVVAALYSGVALVILVVAGFRRGYHLEAFITPRHFVRLGFILATFSATYIYLTFADILPGAYVAENSVSTVFGELLVGRLAPWFWMFAIVGGVLPLLLVALPWTRNIRGMVAAATLVVPMMWLKRMLMVIAPANFDVVTGTSGSYHFTWIPISVTLAALAAIPLLLMLLFRVVPLLSIDEIEEIDENEEMANAAAAEAYQRAKNTRPTAPSQPARHDPELVGATGKAHRGVGAAGAAGVVLLIALLGTFSVGSAPSADAATGTGPKITITGVESGGVVKLTAKLTDAAGAPQAKANVKFLLASNVFGPRQVPLGAAATDTTGTARLTIGTDSKRFRPTASGPQEFVASFTGDGQEPLEFSTNVNVTVARSAFTPAPPKPLDGAGKVLIKALFIIVATIWILLITQVVRVRRACRPLRKNTVRSA